MKRPLKVYSDTKGLHVINGKKKVYIKTTLKHKKVQKVLNKQYEKNKTKIKKTLIVGKDKLKIFRQIPVVNRESDTRSSSGPSPYSVVSPVPASKD